MKKLTLLLGGLALAACDTPTTSSEPAKPKGPPIEITEAARAGDTTRVVMRYRNGGEIAVTDEERAVLRAMEIACNDGENAIPDTRTREGGLLTVNVFCVSVLTTDETIDGSGLLG